MTDADTRWLLSQSRMACLRAGVSLANLEDAVQEVALLLWDDWKKWSGQGNRRKYVGQRARYRVIDWIRITGRKGRHGNVRRPPHVPYPEGLRSGHPSPLEELVDAEPADIPWSALTERDRAIIQKRVEGQTYANIGAAHGISESRVAQILRHEVPAKLSFAGFRP